MGLPKNGPVTKVTPSGEPSSAIPKQSKVFVILSVKMDAAFLDEPGPYLYPKTHGFYLTKDAAISAMEKIAFRAHRKLKGRLVLDTPDKEKYGADSVSELDVVVRSHPHPTADHVVAHANFAVDNSMRTVRDLEHGQYAKMFQVNEVSLVDDE